MESNSSGIVLSCEMCGIINDKVRLYYWERPYGSKLRFQICPECQNKIDEAINIAIEKARRSVTSEFEKRLESIKKEIGAYKNQLTLPV